MSFFPDQLYRFNPEDVQERHLTPLFRAATTALAAATVETDIVLPNDRSVMLQAICALASPGAGQNFTRIIIRLLPQVGGSADLKHLTTAGAVNAFGALDWQGSILLPRSITVRVTALFNSGVAANNADLTLFGVLMPRGNVDPL